MFPDASGTHIEGGAGSANSAGRPGPAGQGLLPPPRWTSHRALLGSSDHPAPPALLTPTQEAHITDPGAWAHTSSGGGWTPEEKRVRRKPEDLPVRKGEPDTEKGSRMPSHSPIRTPRPTWADERGMHVLPGIMSPGPFLQRRPHSCSLLRAAEPVSGGPSGPNTPELWGRLPNSPVRPPSAPEATQGHGSRQGKSECTGLRREAADGELR